MTIERNYNLTEGKCFGNYVPACDAHCEYAESCRYVSDAPEPDNQKRIRNSVNFEKNSFRIKEDQETEETGNGSYDKMTEILYYILTLDDNTLSLLSELVRNPNISQADIARQRGVSRQRINTAMLFAVKKHPELKSIFCLALSKVTASRNRYQRESEDTPADGPVQETLL